MIPEYKYLFNLISNVMLLAIITTNRIKLEHRSRGTNVESITLEKEKIEQEKRKIKQNRNCFNEKFEFIKFLFVSKKIYNEH